MNFDGFNIDDLEAIEIAISLSDKSEDIEVFQLSNNSISDEGLICVISQLRWFNNLKELYLSKKN